jgi:hypothetical protein
MQGTGCHLLLLLLLLECRQLLLLLLGQQNISPPAKAEERQGWGRRGALAQAALCHCIWHTSRRAGATLLEAAALLQMYCLVEQVDASVTALCAILCCCLASLKPYQAHLLAVQPVLVHRIR